MFGIVLRNCIVFRKRAHLRYDDGNSAANDDNHHVWSTPVRFSSKKAKDTKNVSKYG